MRHLYISLKLVFLILLCSLGEIILAQPSCTTPEITSISNSGPVCVGGTIQLYAEGTVGGVASNFVRMAGIGGNFGNREFDELFASGDRPGTIQRITTDQFNGLVAGGGAANVRSTYDVLLFTWASPSNLNINWAFVDQFLSLGGSIFWEDEVNIGKLSPSIIGTQYNGSWGCSYQIVSPAPFPILVANGVNGCFVNHHLYVSSWPSWMKEYIKGPDGLNYAIAGIHPTGGGRLVIQGPDQDFHAESEGIGAGGNQYKMLLNQLDFLVAEQTGISWTGPNGFTSSEASPIITNVNAAYAGVYTATLTNTTGGGCFTTATTTVVVNALPIFSTSDKIVNADENSCNTTVNYDPVTSEAVTNLSYNFSGATAGSGTGTGSGSTFNSGITYVTVEATNACGSNTTSFTIKVNDITPPVITTNGNKTVNNISNNCGAAVSVSASATDNCSVGIPTGTRDDGKALTDEYPVGITTITWNATDDNGNAAEIVTQTVTVINVAPVIDGISAPLDPVAINTSINLDVNYSDNNVTNAAINWGDGSPIQNVSAPANNFVTPHTYTAAGVYRVNVTLTDACNVSSAESVYEYIVVYDPSAGFVTGGGWINSSAGSFLADLSLSGKATFGFVSKYQKGTTIPIGNTEFQFHAGSLNFKSTVYEWLVVSGSKAQFKGSGTVNGSGNYGFLLSSIDGNLMSPVNADKFRIKIWDRSTNATVYDNQMGDSETVDASTNIDNGSIVIHVPKGGRTTTIGNVTMAPNNEEVYEGSLTVKALPNPSKTYFTLVMSGKNNQPLSFRVFDGIGRTVETKSGVASNSTITIGFNYRPGTYYAMVVQGSERITVKLIKLP